LRSMVNICEPLINVVNENKPKVLGCLGQPNPLTGIHRLGPKGKGPRMGAPNSPTADVASPAERRNLTCTGTCTERGKPEDLPVVTTTRESAPQGEPMGLRVEDGGKSECLPVMGRIGVEPGGCTVSATERVHHPARKRADFLPRSLVTRKFGKPLLRGKADDGGLIALAGALSSATNVHIVAPSVYREVVAEVRTVTAGPTKGPSSGSSWMTRKCHVQFLGGWGPAMAPGYPTCDTKLYK
jgi:hypothetical protein